MADDFAESPGGWGLAGPPSGWTDIGQDVTANTAYKITMRMDNSGAVFQPGRKVRLIVGGVDRGLFTVQSWGRGVRLVNEHRRRLARCSRLHAAYRRRRR